MPTTLRGPPAILNRRMGQLEPAVDEGGQAELRFARVSRIALPTEHIAQHEHAIPVAERREQPVEPRVGGRCAHRSHRREA